MAEIIRENIYLVNGKSEHLITRKQDRNNYAITVFTESDDMASNTLVASICFQNGPIKENGVNGCQNEDLIAIVIDRLNDLQKKLSCRENAIAITKLEEALIWLEKRTADRIARGVEGTDII